MHVKHHTGVEDQRHDVAAQAKRAVDPATCTPVGRLISRRHLVLLVLFLLVTIPGRHCIATSRGLHRLAPSPWEGSSEPSGQVQAVGRRDAATKQYLLTNACA